MRRPSTLSLPPGVCHPALRHWPLIAALWLPGALCQAQDQAPTDVPTVKLTPAARSTPASAEYKATQALKRLSATLHYPLVLSDAQVDSAARIIGGPDRRVYFSAGDRVYAVGTDFTGQPLPQRGQWLRIFRDVKPLKDPDTSEVLGMEAQLLGTARWIRGGSLAADGDGGGDQRVPATLDLVSSLQEIAVGDRVLIAQSHAPETLLPHHPSQTVKARVLGLYATAQAQASHYQIISLNKGRTDGLEAGHLLSILTRPGTLADTRDPLRETWRLPAEYKATAMVFLTFDRLAYAVLTETRDSVQVGDHVFAAGNP